MPRVLRRIGWAVLLLALSVPAEREEYPRPEVYLGWITAIQEYPGWRVVSVLQSSQTGQKFQPDDLITAVDDRSIAAVNPITAARILERVDMGAKQAAVIRDGKTMKLQFVQPRAGQMMLPPRVNVLEPPGPFPVYGRDASAPAFTLSDSSGVAHTIAFDDHRWTLIFVWSALCLPNLDALNEMASPAPDGLNIVTVEIGEAPDYVKEIERTRRLRFPVLLGSGGITGPFATKFDNIQPNSTVLVDPQGRVAFVGWTAGSLARSWSVFRELSSRN